MDGLHLPDSDLHQEYCGCVHHNSDTVTLLLCSESQAQAACDVRNSRYDRRLLSVLEDLGSDSTTATLSSSSSFPDRLNQV